MRTRTRIIAAAAAALAPVTVAVAVTVATRGDGRPAATGPRVDAGTTFDKQRDVADADHRSSVTLPSGHVGLGVDDPTDRWVYDERAAVSGEGGSARPPRGGSFVVVAWSIDRDAEPARALDAAYDADAPDTAESLVLVADGKRYPLDHTQHSGLGGSVAIAVGGDGTDVSIEVGYDGVVQSVDARTGRRTPGRAAALYGATVLGTGSCGTPTIVAPFAGATGAPFSCDYRVRRLAYLTGPGWAPSGRVWLVIELDHDTDDVTLVRAGREQRYRIDYLDTPTAVVGGADGRDAKTSWGSGYRSALYYSIPLATRLPSTISLGQTFSVTPAGERNAEGVRLAVSWRLAVR